MFVRTPDRDVYDLNNQLHTLAICSRDYLRRYMEGYSNNPNRFNSRIRSNFENYMHQYTSYMNRVIANEPHMACKLRVIYDIMQTLWYSDQYINLMTGAGAAFVVLNNPNSHITMRMYTYQQNILKQFICPPNASDEHILLTMYCYKSYEELVRTVNAHECESEEYNRLMYNAWSCIDDLLLLYPNSAQDVRIRDIIEQLVPHLNDTLPRCVAIFNRINAGARGSEKRAMDCTEEQPSNKRRRI